VYTSAGTEPVIQANGLVKKLLTMPVDINEATQVNALIDSGASSNFMHEDMARKLNVKLQDQKEPQPVKDIQGRALGWISKYARTAVNVGQHQEVINFNVIPLGIHGLVLGLPWLQKHDPEITWSEQRLRFNSPYCKTNCIKKVYKRLRPKVNESPLLHHKLEEQKLQEEEVNDLTLNPIEHHEPGKVNKKNRSLKHHESDNVNKKKEAPEHHGSARRQPGKNPIKHHKSDKANKKNRSLEHHKSDNVNKKNRPPKHHRPGKKPQGSSFEHHESEQKKDLQGVPVKYHDFTDVFDLNKARIMPKDRGIWNFKINFIKGWENKLPRVAK